ncbi:MAG: hypothetical protein CM15mP93_01460 [Thiotrichaceae bacterium]|nr:MAG: hypothetical protein CM15mP93_01460 [Thiotrichaceae bacterium]
MSLDAGDVKVLLEGIMDENTSKKLGETKVLRISSVREKMPK